MTRAVEFAWQATFPAVVMLTVTHKCQLACAHCYQSKHDSEDLTTDELVALMDELVQLGTLHLVFTGGEALLRKDIFTLIGEARKRAFAVTLFSNGGPINAATARKIRELRVMSVEISLHGSHAATHDGLVGRQGSFERAVRAIELLDDEGVAVQVKSSIVRCNIHEISEVQKLFAARPRVRWSGDMTLFPKDDGTSVMHERATPEMIQKYFAELLSPLAHDDVAQELAPLHKRTDEVALEKSSPCGAGRTVAAVQPNGDVLACIQIPTLPLGNLRQKRFSEMWLDSPPVRALRELTLQRFTECKGCEYRHVCAKCPALSLTETGALDGHSKQVCERTKTFWGALKQRLAETQQVSATPMRAQLGSVVPSEIGFSVPTAPRRFSLRVVGG